MTAPREIAAILNRLLATDVEVWLIGSRVDGTAKAASDWDFVVFGGRDVLERLQREPAVPSMDILVVIDANTYISPRPRLEDGQRKRGTRLFQEKSSLPDDSAWVPRRVDTVGHWESVELHTPQKLTRRVTCN